MFASKERSHAPASANQVATVSRGGGNSQSLAALGAMLNGGPRATGLTQLRRALNPPGEPVVQLMPKELREPFVKETVERAQQRGIKGDDLQRVQIHAQFLAARKTISVDDAVLKMEIEYRRIELLNQVAKAEEDNVPRGQIAESVAGMFGTSVATIIERYVAPFLDEKGELPKGFLAAVSHNAEFGAKDIEVNMTDAVGAGLVAGQPEPLKYMDQLDRYISANIDFGKYYGNVDSELKNAIHFVWSGRPISESALANIQSWAERAKGTPWQVVLWTDAGISDWTKAAPLLQRSKVRLIDVAKVVDPRLRQAYGFAREHNLAGASDLIRLSLMKRFGGMYADVDIGPGEVNLAATTTPGPLERPLLAPGLRDAQGVRDLLNLGADVPITKAHVEKAARLQRQRGQPNNNFISSAPNSIGLNPIINHIARTTSNMDAQAWKGAGGFIAGVTGPMAIGGVLDRMGGKGQLPHSEPSDTVTDLPLEWLTPESEEQSWAH